MVKKNKPGNSTIENSNFKPNKLNKIRKLFIENFKGFSKRNDILFSPSINLFYGKNSAGKSSIIQSLRLLKQSLLIQGPPIPLLLVLPSYTRVTGSLTFQEGITGIINSKDKNKELLLGLSSYGTYSKENKKRISRYLIHKFNLKKADEQCLKEVNFGRGHVNNESYFEYKNFSDFNFKFNKKIFKKGKLVDLLNEAFLSPRYDFDYNIKERLEDKNIPKEEILYEELDINKSNFSLMSLDRLHENILKNLQKNKEKIKNIINTALKPIYGIEFENLKKLKVAKKGKKKSLSLKMATTGMRLLEEGKYSIIKKADLIALRNFINSKALNDKKKFKEFFIKDFEKKINIIRYKDKFFDINVFKANIEGQKLADSRNILPAREYDIYLANILFDAMDEPTFDFCYAHQACLKQVRNTIDKVVVVPGLRALPQRYLRRGLQENLIGENAENLGDMIANPETKKSLNYWFNKFGIPYNIDAELVGNYYEIVMKPIGKKYKLSYRDVGLGYSLSLPLLVTCLTNKDSIILIEEPELHLHPKMQASLMDLFLHSSIKNKNQFIIETHSENLLLRAQKCLRKGYEFEGKKINIDKDCVSVNNVYEDNGSSNVQRILLNSKGEFKTHWKDGFFAERLDELF